MREKEVLNRRLHMSYTSQRFPLFHIEFTRSKLPILFVSCIRGLCVFIDRVYWHTPCM